MTVHVKPEMRAIPREVAARQLASARLFVAWVEEHPEDSLPGFTPDERLAVLSVGREFLGWLTLASADLGRLS